VHISAFLSELHHEFGPVAAVYHQIALRIEGVDTWFGGYGSGDGVGNFVDE
jgi:hypothetical protein